LEFFQNKTLDNIKAMKNVINTITNETMGEFMAELKNIETHLVKKTANTPKVCMSCNNDINIGEIYHKEEGVTEHLHSLISRYFCSECYAKYGEKKLLAKQKF
jgi:predicted aldo/keto reductase-like oxidoreductase